MTTPQRTDYSREESLRILGAAAIAEIDRIVAAAPPPTPRQVQVLQRVFDVIDQDIALAVSTESSAAA